MLKKLYRYFLSFSFTALPLLLAGCQANFTPEISQDNNHFIEGQWIDNHGIISTFHNGMMTTHAADTQEKLAEGNYNFLPSGTLHIELRSLVRGTVSDVLCSINQREQMLTCNQDSNLPSFTLKRRAQ